MITEGTNGNHRYIRCPNRSAFIILPQKKDSDAAQQEGVTLYLVSQNVSIANRGLLERV